MWRLICSSLITLFFVFEVQAQAPAHEKSKLAIDPDKFVTDWIDRLNALDDWHISMLGEEEGVDKVVDHMMELFAPDVLAEVPPHDEDQIGPVMLMGSGQVRKWLDNMARTQVKLEYIPRVQTEKEFEGALVVYTKTLPWGGLGISFQINGNYALRRDRRKYTAPGAGFIQLGEDGKIHRLRLLLGEISEVTLQ
jgi:hypothetical protein